MRYKLQFTTFHILPRQNVACVCENVEAFHVELALICGIFSHSRTAFRDALFVSFVFVVYLEFFHRPRVVIGAFCLRGVSRYFDVILHFRDIPFVEGYLPFINGKSRKVVCKHVYSSV